jgi:hypothetical protein
MGKRAITAPRLCAFVRLLGAALAEPMAEALEVARQQPVAYVVGEVWRAALETGAAR